MPANPPDGVPRRWIVQVLQNSVRDAGQDDAVEAANILTDGRGHAPESAGPSPSTSFCAFWGEKGPFDRLESALEAFLGVDPARFEVLGFPDASINHLHVRLRKER